MKEGYGIGGREPVGTDDGRSILLTSGVVVSAAVAASSAVVVPSATASSVTAMMRRRHTQRECVTHPALARQWHGLVSR